MNDTPIEIERKYIIEIPDILLLEGQENYSVSDIEQIYLSSSPFITHRIRKRSYADRTVYTETKKIRIDKISAYEDEHDISESEYAELSELMKAGTVPVRKRRHVFYFGGQCFEIDVYPAWTKCCILETELASREVNVQLPSFLKIVKEVSGMKEYSNASMSKKFPKELEI